MSFLTNVVKVLEALGIKNKVFNDKRYVNTTGDLMTGGLGIQPSVDSLTALVVNDKDANNVLTVDTVNNSVGIGTTNPSVKLNVIANINQKAAIFEGNDMIGYNTWFKGTSAGFLMGQSNNRSMIQGVNASGVVYGDVLINPNSGNVGIGTTSPAVKLTIASTSALESAALGSELLSSSNWTLGTGWSGDFTAGFTHTAGTGNTSTLTNTLAAVVNNYYQIAYTVTNRTAGSFTVAFGGQSSSGISASGAWGPRATTTGNLVITPTSDFNGTIVISIKTISTYSPTFALYDSTNASSFEIRNSLSSLNNTFIGKGVGRYNTTGNSNSAQGVAALQYNTTGSNNSAQGYASLFSNTTGYNNIAQGVSALSANTTGEYNSAQGSNALRSNTTGSNNSAQGYGSLYSNKTGSNGVAIGYESQYYANDTTTAWTNSNTSIGYQALRGSTTAANNTGTANTAIGYQSLINNSSGGNNSTLGVGALYANTSGSHNLAIGRDALAQNTTGNYNVALGNYAGSYTSIGNNQTSSSSTYIGYYAKALADAGTNEIVIGYNAIGNGSNTIKLGNTSITNVASNGDFEALDIGDGFILKSPDGTRYRVTVANGGALSAVAV